MRLSELTPAELEPIARARIAEVKRTNFDDWKALQACEEVEWEYCRRYLYPEWFRIWESVKADD